MNTIWIIFAVGGVLSIIGAVAYAAITSKRTSTTSKATNAADASMLAAVVDLFGENDIDAAIKVLELQRERKKPA